MKWSDFLAIYAFVLLIIKGSNIKKYFGDRLILDIKDLKIYSNDRIGIVGVNGVGKTTLIKILIGTEEQHSGKTHIFGEYSYMPQLINTETNSSGGEKGRILINKAFSKKSTKEN